MIVDLSSTVLLYLTLRGSTESARHFSCQTDRLERRNNQLEWGSKDRDWQKDQDRKQMIFKHQDSGGDKSGGGERAMETEKERTARVRGVERVTHPSVESTFLSLSLSPRLSAPGSHTRGASHSIITLKWLLPHQ